MACYHPNLVYLDVDETGEIHYRFTKDSGFLAVPGKSISVPCRKCIGCLLDHSRHWADRMMLELDHSKKGLFLTLTYNNENLPFGFVKGFSHEYGLTEPILVKKHWQDFMKRLRYYFPDNEIRFYMCGEYGGKTHRPHYHAILFGIGLDDLPDLVPYGKNEFGQDYFTSHKIADIWNKGFISLSEVSWRTCAYVARYVQKKEMKQVEYAGADPDSVPEFVLMSRNPGIGGFYASEHPDAVETGRAFVSNSNDIDSVVKRINLPDYVLKDLKETNPKVYNEIKRSRSELAENKLLLELQNTDLIVEDYMAMKEQNLRRKLTKNRLDI